MTHCYSKKQEADGLKKIPISWLNKQGFLKSYASGVITWTQGWSGVKSRIGIAMSINNEGGYMNLNYAQIDRFNDENKDFDYTVHLTTTLCHFGNKRYWFLCPLEKDGQSCGRRVVVLYKGGDYFGCRDCYNLTYASRNKNNRSRDGPLLRHFDLSCRVGDLEKGIKKRVYAGKPTKKQGQIDSLRKQVALYEERYKL